MKQLKMLLLSSMVMLFTACGGGSSGTSTTPITPATIISLEITTLNSTVAKGLDIEMVNTAYFSDGSSQIVTSNTTWISKDTTIITADTENIGTFNTIEEGTAIVIAQYNGFEANTAITVSSAELISIVTSPETINLGKGEELQLTATGTYTDSERDITENVIWHSTDETIATVTSAGLLQAVAIGNCEIYASLGDIESTKQSITVGNAVLASISITPERIELMRGETATFTATGVMSDGTVMSLSSVNWSVDKPGSVSISDDGILLVEQQPAIDYYGTVIVTASVDNIIGHAYVEVIAGVLESFTITVPNTLENKTSASLTAEGTYSDTSIKDISNLVTWISSDPLIASISGSYVTGNTEGTVTISAELNGITQSSQMEVTPEIWQDKISIGKSIRASCINGYCTYFYGFTIKNNSSTDLIVESYVTTNSVTSEVIDFQITSSNLEAASSVEISRTSTSSYPGIDLIFTLREPLTNETKTFTSSL